MFVLQRSGCLLHARCAFTTPRRLQIWFTISLHLGRGGKSMGGAGQTVCVSGPLCRGGGVRRIGLRVGQAE
jgi:hypothetical protein